jgi:hypothetical protein
MSKTVLESLNTIRRLESSEVLNESAAAPAAAVASKGIGRFIPGVGAAMGAYDAYNRAKKGDWGGAGLSALGGAASLIPGVGTAASIGVAGAQALRDKQRTGSYMPGEDEIAAGVAKDTAAQPTTTAAAPAPVAPTTPAGVDPKVLALQKQLIAKGAKIKADGVMGDQTRTAMKQFPGVAVAEQNKGNDMSESQRIAELMSRLAQIEQAQQVAEGPLDAIKAGFGAAKNFMGGAKAGMQGGSAASSVASGAAGLGKAGDKGMAAAQAVKNAGQAVKTAATGNTAKNVAKVGGGAAAGAAGVAALTGAGAAGKATPATPATPAVPAKPTTPATPAAPAATAPAVPAADPKDVAELNAIAQELESSRDPAIIALMQQYNGVINAVNNRGAGDKRTNAEIATGADLKDAGV